MPALAWPCSHLVLPRFPPRCSPPPAPAIMCWSRRRLPTTRNFCNGVFKKFGAETTYYDPLIGADIAKLFKPNTRVVFVEAPGSQSFEMQDIPAIAKIAHDKGAVVLMDNTWATPLYFRAFEKGVDLEIQAGTKYIGGHSDITFGCVSANAATLPAVKDTVYSMGLCVGPDDMYLALRGLRTLGVRLDRHYQSGLRVARWLERRPEILRVMHPALESDPGHKIWKRDFTGACGLFSVVFKPTSEQSVHGFLNELALFGLGYSWGGFESLAILFDCQNTGPPPNGHPADQQYVSILAWKTPTTLSRILSADLRR